MHEVLVNRLGGLSLPRKSVVRLTDRPDMTLDVYRGRKTTIQQQQQTINLNGVNLRQGIVFFEVNTSVVLANGSSRCHEPTYFSHAYKNFLESKLRYHMH